MAFSSTFAERRRGLPHAFPFELVDSAEEAGVLVRLSGDAFYSRGQPLPAPLAIEILAQAASFRALAEAARESSGPMLLVGIEEARFCAALVPGDTLWAKTEIAGSFGGMVKVNGQLRDAGGTVVAEAGLLLASSEA